MDHGLDRDLFDAVTAQLKAKVIKVKTGTLVDATIIASASEDDSEGRWVKHKGSSAVHGFKAHVHADATTALVEKIAVLIEGHSSAVPRVVLTAMWVRDERETLARLEACNQPIHRIRGRIEKIFGT